MTAGSDHLWTSDSVVAATGGACAESWHADGVSIDSRTVNEGDLFVAIDGLNQDGHKYVANAFENGASAALVHRSIENADGPLVHVDDTLEGLNALGVAARARTKARIVAVTGSVGKTSTKEALRVALAASGATHTSAASYNNLWGVPLSLARMPAPTEFGVFEVGMNHAGEIAPLVAMVRPHVAIVTTVQPVHIEFFDSVDGIADEKGEIFSAFEEGGTAIINADNPHHDRLKKIAQNYNAQNVLSFGTSKTADMRLINAETADSGSNVVAEFQGKRISYRVGLPGDHFVANSLAVLSAVIALGGDLDAGAHALASLTPTEGRGVRHTIELNGDSFLLIDESYNANPSSVAAALRVLSDSSPSGAGRRIAVLGDMLELGQDADAYHRQLSESLHEDHIDQVFLCGKHMKALWNILPKDVQGAYAKDSESLIQSVHNSLRGGDVVMVKGSLGSQMGKIVQHLLAHAANANSAGGG